MDKKDIKQLWWSGAKGDELVVCPVDGKIVCQNEYHGTYDLDWAVVYDKDGKEIARHNLLYVASIEWVDEYDHLHRSRPHP